MVNSVSRRAGDAEKIMYISRYQIAIIDNTGTFAARLRDLLTQRVSELNVDTRTLLFLDENNADTVDLRAPRVAVYFGRDTPTPIQTAAVEQLVRKSVFIVPVVTSLTDYQAKVPKALHPVNGMEISGPVDLPRVASHLLEGLHLLRRRR